ncbi:MAG TPA: hypothetical protein PLQ57_16625, partial [Saprospiraceae bacterium]|nr:hypothetical protein [Saprospiraceae bacterium]
IRYFGEIVDEKIILSETGEIAQSMWYEIPKHSPVAQLGAFVVMPDHVHGILILNNPKYLIEWGIDNDEVDHNYNNNLNEGNRDDDYEFKCATIKYDNDLHFHHQRNQFTIGESIGKNRFQNIGKNTVSSIIGSYKSAVTKHANRKGLENGWQPLFYERIIKNHSAYHRITKYINDNPKKWKG